MKSNRPVGSVTDREGWDWNKRQAEQESTERSSASSDSQRYRNQKRARSERDVASKREIKRLEAELEQAEKRLQSVINHYERLLKKKNRQLDNLTRPASKPRGQSTRISKICQYLSDY